MVEGLKPIESAAEFDALIAGDKLVSEPRIKERLSRSGLRPLSWRAG